MWRNLTAAAGLALVLVGCDPYAGTPGREFACYSRCGLTLVDASGTCAEWQGAEDRALLAYARNVPGWIPAYACPRIQYWRVHLHEPDDRERGSWWDPWQGQNVSGLTWCDRKIIEVEVPAVEGAWHTTSLTHELAHAVEVCADPKHVHWSDRGIWRAIDESNSFVVAP